MKYLEYTSFKSARNFIRSEARPLEKVIFEHRFESGDAEAVITELQRFQNEDGGFGRALEPDVRTPSSSALATGHGLEILKDLGCPADHNVVQKAIAYLLETFDERQNVWRVIPEDANAYPHAPWWHDDRGSLVQTFDKFLIIPRAQILGLLWHYAAMVDQNWLNALTELTVADIENIPSLGTGGGDDLRYTLSLTETVAVPQDFKIRLLTRVREVVPLAVSRDEDHWSSYRIRPLKVVTSLNSPVHDLLKTEVQANLDYLINEQTSAGYWEPVWSWGDFYPEMWPQARSEWRGMLTLEALTYLQIFGRIKARD